MSVAGATRSTGETIEKIARPRSAGARPGDLPWSRAAGGAEALSRELHPRTGRARLIGVTGPPGAGKSTLVEALARRELRAPAGRVAVLAVDPTSPFTGGALLGDRVRMQSLDTDPGVFIRSMATRGAPRAASPPPPTTRSTCSTPPASTCVLVETVGVGQDEIDVVAARSTRWRCVVVPGMGDDVQAEKAGLLEIADVFVLNKADRDGADETFRDLRDHALGGGRRPGRPAVG